MSFFKLNLGHLTADTANKLVGDGDPDGVLVDRELADTAPDLALCFRWANFPAAIHFHVQAFVSDDLPWYVREDGEWFNEPQHWYDDAPLPQDRH